MCFWISVGLETTAVLNVYEVKAMENAADKTSSVLQNFLSWCEKHKIKICPKVMPYIMFFIVESGKESIVERIGLGLFI